MILFLIFRHVFGLTVADFSTTPHGPIVAVLVAPGHGSTVDDVRLFAVRIMVALSWILWEAVIARLSSFECTGWVIT